MLKLYKLFNVFDIRVSDSKMENCDFYWSFNKSVKLML